MALPNITPTSVNQLGLEASSNEAFKVPALAPESITPKYNCFSNSAPSSSSVKALIPLNTFVATLILAMFKLPAAKAFNIAPAKFRGNAATE